MQSRMRCVEFASVPGMEYRPVENGEVPSGHCSKATNESHSQNGKP
jgi:hypothetical protein